MSDSGFREQILTRVIGSNGFEFLHQVANALVGRLRDDNLDFDVLIAAGTVACAWYALFPQSQSAPIVGARRKADGRTSFVRGDFHFCAESRLAYGDGK